LSKDKPITSYQGANVLFSHRKECIYSINGRCIDMLSKYHGKCCSGVKKCNLSWSDDGWIKHMAENGEL
jgi:hypothetical protein